MENLDVNKILQINVQAFFFFCFLSLTANTKALGYLILFTVICHPLKVAHQELKGVIIVIWEVVDLNKEVWRTRSE